MGFLKFSSWSEEKETMSDSGMTSFSVKVDSKLALEQNQPDWVLRREDTRDQVIPHNVSIMGDRHGDVIPEDCIRPGA